MSQYIVKMGSSISIIFFFKLSKFYEHSTAQQ